MALTELSLWTGLCLLGLALYLCALQVPAGMPRRVLQLLAFTVGYVGVNQVSYASYFGPVGQDPGVFWLSSGLAMGVLLVVERRWIPVFALVCLGVHLHSGLVLHGLDLKTSAFWTSANVLEALIGSLLFRRVNGGPPDITRPREFVLFCLLCAGVATAVSAAIGTTSLNLIYGRAEWVQDWQVWWFSDAMGVLSLGTTILAWHAAAPRRGEHDRAWRRAEAGGLVVLFFLVTLISLGPYSLTTRSVLEFPYLVVPLLAWAALRFGARTASTAALFVAVTTVYTANGTFAGLPLLPGDSLGPFRAEGVPVAQSVLAIQAFLFVMLFATQMLVAITRQRERAEQQALDYRDQLYEAQRTESVAELAGGVAHDINNMLAVIVAYRERLHEEVGHRPELAPSLDAMDQAATQAATLSRSLMELSQGGGPAAFAPVNLSRLVRQSVRLYGQVLPASIRLKLKIPGDPPLVIQANQTRLRQVILNLLVNARDAIEANEGDIEVWLGPSSDKPGQVELGFRDTGGGIGPEVLPRIFEPLFTTKPHGKGTGLGLSVVRSVVTEHGGDIHVQSVLGKGTTFRIALPIESGRPLLANEQVNKSGVWIDGRSSGKSGTMVLDAPRAAGKHREAVLLLQNTQVRGALMAELVFRGWHARAVDGLDQFLAVPPGPDGTIRLGVLDIDALADRNGAGPLELPIPTVVVTRRGSKMPVIKGSPRELVMPFRVVDLVELLEKMG